MASAFAKAYVQLVPQAEGFSAEAEKTLSGFNGSAGASGSKTGKTFGTKFKTAALVGMGAVLAGFTALAKAGFDAGSELEQNLGGTEAVFGRYSESIQTAAQDAYKNMGMSASDYMATANKMGALFQGSGMEQVQALKLTEAAMQRAADVASVMGLDTSAAMEAIAGAAKGNFTMMDNLGVAMNETTLQAYAMEQGMDKAQYAALAGAEKSELAIQMFMERTSQYAGNFARESEQTLSGSLGAMKAIATDLVANLALGENISPQLAALGETVKSFVTGNLAPMLLNIAEALPDVITGLISGFGELLPQLLPVGIDIVKAIINGITQGIGQLLETAWDLFTQFSDKLISSDWSNIGHNIIEGIKQGLSNALGGLLEAAKDIALSAWKTMKSALGIKSPSKKFAELGKFSVEGFAHGINDNENLIKNTMSKITESATNGTSVDMFTVQSSINSPKNNTTVSSSAQAQTRELDSMTNAILGGLNLVIKAINDKNTNIVLDETRIYKSIKRIEHNQGPSLVNGGNK